MWQFVVTVEYAFLVDFPLFNNIVIYFRTSSSIRGGSHVSVTDDFVASFTFRSCGGPGVSRTLTLTNADLLPELFSMVSMYLPLSNHLRFQWQQGVTCGLDAALSKRSQQFLGSATSGAGLPLMGTKSLRVQQALMVTTAQFGISSISGGSILSSAFGVPGTSAVLNAFGNSWRRCEFYIPGSL